MNDHDLTKLIGSILAALITGIVTGAIFIRAGIDKTTSALGTAIDKNRDDISKLREDVRSLQDLREEDKGYISNLQTALDKMRDKLDEGLVSLRNDIDSKLAGAKKEILDAINAGRQR